MNRASHPARTRIQRQTWPARERLGFRSGPWYSSRGLDNLAYEVDGELVVRVAGCAPLPVPEPGFTDREHGCKAYAKIPACRYWLPQPHRLAGHNRIGCRTAKTLTVDMGPRRSPAVRQSSLFGATQTPPQQADTAAQITADTCAGFNADQSEPRAQAHSVSIEADPKTILPPKLPT